MKGRKHTPEQIVRKLREADWMLGEGSGDWAPTGRLARIEHTPGDWRRTLLPARMAAAAPASP